MTKSFFFFFLFFFSASGFTNPQAKDFFNQGVQSYKQQNFKEASEKFTEASKLAPPSVNSLYNLGLVELKQENIAKAAAFWRRALELNPWHKPSRQSLKSIEAKLPLSHQVSIWEKFRHAILSYFSFQMVMVLFTVSLIGALSTCIKYFTRRYIAYKNSFPMPPFSKSTLVYSLFFILFSILMTAKAYDSMHPRATVVSSSAPIYLSPDKEDIKILEIDQGSELIINQTQDQWAKVQTPRGNKGWVELNNLYQTSGDLSL